MEDRLFKIDHKSSSTPAPEGRPPDFMDLWIDGEKLASVIYRLPGELVLRLGLSALRRDLLDRWESLEPPAIDGSIPSEQKVLQWNRDARSIIAFTVESGRADSRVALRLPNGSDRIIESIDGASSVNSGWHWPWAKKSPRITGNNIDRGKIIKFGAIASLGAIVLVSYFDEE